MAWVFSAASNTVTIRLTPGSGPSSHQILARSHLTIFENGNGRHRRQAADGATARVPVPPGRRTRLLVRVQGPRPLRRTLTVTAPPALRVIAARRGRAGLLLSLSSPLRRPPRGPLCGRDRVSYPERSQVAVARSPDPCRTRLTVTAADGERTVVRVAVPTLPEVPLYAFASAAGRAIYLTVDDGWTPSREVLAIMRRTHLPLTAFLIEQAAQRDLPYWRSFVKAGGMVGDHTVSHPDLTRLTLSQATGQWGQARLVLGQWLGRAPVLGLAAVRGLRPHGGGGGLPQRAEGPGGLERHRRQRRDPDLEQPRLEPGEIVLLHWVPGLGHQLTKLLAAIHARHLHPLPLTPASFVGITPQQHSLDGD